MVFWSLHANQTTKSEYITQSKWCIGLLLPFFFPSNSLFLWKMLSSQLNYWVESVFCLIVNKGLRNMWDWILHRKTILIWKKYHHQILRWVFFGPILDVSLLKEKPYELACWFCVGFFQARINYDDLSAEVNKDLHLTFVECAAGRREKSWWQSSSFAGREFGKGAGSTSDAGWDSQTCLLLSPEQSQESHGGEGWRLPNPRHSPVFVLCLQRLLTTASPLQFLLIALTCALAGEVPTQEKVVGIRHQGGCFSQGLLWAALVWVSFY